MDYTQRQPNDQEVRSTRNHRPPQWREWVGPALRTVVAEEGGDRATLRPRQASSAADWCAGMEVLGSLVEASHEHNAAAVFLANATEERFRAGGNGNSMGRV